MINNHIWYVPDSTVYILFEVYKIPFCLTFIKRQLLSLIMRRFLLSRYIAGIRIHEPGFGSENQGSNYLRSFPYPDLLPCKKSTVVSSVSDSLNPEPDPAF